MPGCLHVRILLVVLVGLSGLAVPPSSAAAHVELVSSTPRDGSRSTQEPTSIELTFDENVAQPAFVVVTAPDGSRLDAAHPQVLDNTVTGSVGAVGLAGTYTLAYRVVGADGHPISGEIRYTVTSGREPQTDAMTSAPADDASFWSGHWPHVFIALGGGLAALFIAPIRRRRA